MLDLDPIKKRLHAATGCAPDEAGTWRAVRDITEEVGAVDIRTDEKQFDDPTMPIALVMDYDDEWPNAEFIAHAPADVAALVAEVERLTLYLEAIASEPWRAGGADAAEIAREALAADVT